MIYIFNVSLFDLNEVLKKCIKDHTLTPLDSFSKAISELRKEDEKISAIAKVCIAALKESHDIKEIRKFRVCFNLLCSGLGKKDPLLKKIKFGTTNTNELVNNFVDERLKALSNPEERKEERPEPLKMGRGVIKKKLRTELDNICRIWNETEVEVILKRLLPKEFSSLSLKQKLSCYQRILSFLQLEAKIFQLVESDLTYFFANENIIKQLKPVTSIQSDSASNSVFSFQIPVCEGANSEAFALSLLAQRFLRYKCKDKLGGGSDSSVFFTERFLNFLNYLDLNASRLGLSDLRTFVLSRISLIQHVEAQNAFLAQYKHWIFAQEAFESGLTKEEFFGLRERGRALAETATGLDWRSSCNLTPKDEIPLLLLPYDEERFRQFNNLRKSGVFFIPSIFNTLERLSEFDDEQLICTMEQEVVRAYKIQKDRYQALYQKTRSLLEEEAQIDPIHSQDAFIDLSGNGKTVLPNELLLFPSEEESVSPQDYLRHRIQRHKPISKEDFRPYEPKVVDRPQKKQDPKPEEKKFFSPVEEEPIVASPVEVIEIPLSLPGSLPPFFSCDDRVTRWLKCSPDRPLDPEIFPEYQECSLGYQRRMIELHGSSPLIDRFCEMGFEIEGGKKGERVLGIAAEIQREDRLERGVMCWAIRTKDGGCYHRFFHRLENTNELVQKIVDQTFKAADFPELTQEILESSQKNTSLKVEDLGMVTVNGLGTVEIQDKRLGVVIRLYPTKIE